MVEAASTELPLVSIVVPMFNSERYIQSTIDSVLRQVYPNLEVLCVDDFSDDATAEIVMKASIADPRVRYLQNDHKGANGARCKGVSCAQGDLIMFLDSDDELIEGAVGRLVELLQANNVDLVCANILYSEGGRESLRFSYPSSGLAVNLEKNPKAMLEVKPSACGKLFSARLFEGLRFINVPFAQDWNISYKALVNVRRIFFSDEEVYRYKIRRDSTSTRKSILQLEELLAVLPCLKDILSYRGIEGRRIGAQEAVVISSRFILNMVGRSFHLAIEDRRAAHQHLRRSYLASVDLRMLAKAVCSDRGRGALLLFALSSWPAYEVVRTGWFRARGVS